MMHAPVFPRPHPETATLDLAVLVYDFRGSGVVRNALRIAAAARAQGLRTELWVVHADGALAGEVPPGVSVLALADANPLLKRCRHRALAIALATRTLARALAGRRPRVLLSSGNHVHWLAAEANTAARHPARLVMRASNDLFHRRGGPLAAVAGAVRGLVARTLMRRVFARADQVVAVSRDLAHQMEEALKLGHVSVIPNGVPLDWVAGRAEAPLDDPWFAPGAPPVVLGIGRLVKQKNFPLLLDAFARLRQTRPCRLVILGEGSARARAALQRQAARLGIAQDVRLAGFDPNPHRYLARAALFVLSSAWEGSSNALLEALACGCPVVATDCRTGPREVLAHGRYGPLVPVDNAEALAAAMEWRMAQPREAALLKVRARTFDAGRMLDAYVALLAGQGEGRRRNASPSPVKAPYSAETGWVGTALPVIGKNLSAGV